ncbi:hypothetical protein [Tenacibaculum halocynthiae]|uniref:hypothetical protein n=1 Tax=Tenacibaculum halocynthiae TaxID=1254437 RepID=UPI003D652FC8
MNKQQKTYFLLVAVLIVWGLIGYQFFKKINPTENEVLGDQIPKKYIPEKINKSKSYVVIAKYRDPFLGTMFSEQKKVKRKNIAPKQEMNIPFPTVVYNGIVEGGNSKSYTITVNGKQDLLRIGEELLGVKLIKANSKQIKVHFNTVIKTIKLQ